MTVLNLFRGQCTGAKVDVIADDCIVTIDVEDYNRLPPIIAVGAPAGGFGITQADGTTIFMDTRAQVGGIAAAFAQYPTGYWPLHGVPDLDLVTGFLATDLASNVPTDLGLDWGDQLSDLAAFVSAQLPYISGAARWWLAPPLTGDGLILYVVDYNDPDQVALLPAPYEIDSDTPDWATRIMPIHLGPIAWDWAGLRDSAYIRGGTPVGAGSGWGFGSGGGRMGDAYIDSPGSITEDDLAAIAAWHQAQEYKALLTGSATMPGSLGTTTFGGWHIGQTVLVTSSKHSRLDGMFAGDRDLAARPCVIQGVKGRLVTPAGGLAIVIDGNALTLPFEWRTLTFEEQFGSTGKATAVIHLPGDTDRLTISDAADIWITMDDAAPADIEWDLTFGDVPAGSLARELAKVELPASPAVVPVYRFKVTIADPSVPIGQSSQVSAQLCDGAEAPIALGSVPMEWLILANDGAGDPLDTTGWLADDTGTTDSAGRVFTTYTPGADAASVEIDALALPIA